ncbi:MAG: hypothetical protein JW913_08200 [Chitinispirillaceae bacterium]|nr:hypothetical protein [Chitinispirillaceae bacterium]
MAETINSTALNGSATVKEDKGPGRSSTYLRPDELLRQYSVSLTNAQSDDGIGEAMAGYGYGSDRINEGVTLHGRVVDLFARQKKEYGEQLEASASLKEIFAKADAAYGTSYKVARIAFENDPNAYTALMLSGTRSKLISLWFKQTDTFYRNILQNNDFLLKIGEYGYTSEKLSGEHSLVQEVMAANARHKRERGESQEATKVRDAAMENLEAWMSKFYRIAKIACAGHDQWLEKLGIREA